MVHRVLLRLVLLGVSLPTVACSGGDGGASFLESCTGSYVCVLDGELVSSHLGESEGRCYLGSLELRPDGTCPTAKGAITTWSGDAERLEICSGGSCLVCHSNAAPMRPSSSSGTCTGSAQSCSSVEASSCTDQGGCHYTVGSNISSTSDDGCAGSARPCSDFNSDPARCELQRGCSWR
jgi:hypothetical protein